MQRKSDKIQVIFGALIVLVQVFLLYIVFPMEGRLGKRIDSIEDTQKEIINYYLECKQDISDIKVAYPKAIADRAEKTIEQIDKKIEKMIAWLRDRDKRNLL